MNQSWLLQRKTKQDKTKLWAHPPNNQQKQTIGRPKVCLIRVTEQSPSWIKVYKTGCSALQLGSRLEGRIRPNNDS